MTKTFIRLTRRSLAAVTGGLMLLAGLGSASVAAPTPEILLPPIDPTPGLGICQVEFVGRTTWELNKDPVTESVAYHAGEVSNNLGTILTSGHKGNGYVTLWVAAATDTPLKDVTFDYRVTSGAIEGGHDTPDVSPQLFGSLATQYPNPVSGLELTTSQGGHYSGTVESMPKGSGFSVTEHLSRDWHETIYVSYRVIGTVPDCNPNPSADLVETGPWVKGEPNCLTRRVPHTREVTTRTHTFDAETFSWVAGEPTVTTETEARPMTEAEIAACTPDTEKPTTTPTTKPASSETEDDSPVVPVKPPAKPTTQPVPPAAEPTESAEVTPKSKPTPTTTVVQNQAAEAAATTTTRATLARTGADGVLPLITLGVLLLGAGTAAVLYARRPQNG